MTEELKIKNEFIKFNNLQCGTCLSVGRTLQPLGAYLQLFKTLLPNINETYISICWECQALLSKVRKFQHQTARANELLTLGQVYMYGSLTNLTTIILNDTHQHIVYFNEQIYESTQTSSESHSEVNEINGEDDVDICDDYYLNSKATVTDNPIVIKEEIKTDLKNNETVKRVNKWAKKRAKQNKKPKFQIISAENVMNTFRKVCIDISEVKRFIETEKVSEYFALKRFKCELCVTGFDKERSLLKHNEKSHGKNSGQYTCDICNTRILNKRHLASHVEKHYYKWQCLLCTFSCHKAKSAQLHAQTRHRRVFQCLKCELKFESRREFFKHFKDWHERYTCDHCGITFKMRYCIKDHIRKQHSPFECKLCSKRFARYNGLWLHNKTKHGPPAPPAYCVECDKRYPDIFRYRWHLANSTRHTPKEKVRVPCPGCDKIFSKNIYMKDHYNVVHLKNYKYRCEQCDKNFIRNAELVKHKRRVHEGILPPKNKICYLCGRGFSTNKILSNHVRTHTGERPFACARCPATFAQRAALGGHARSLHRTH